MSPRKAPCRPGSIDTVRAILDATGLVLKFSGPTAVSTVRVAQTAGVAVGTLYQYFPAKEALVTAWEERLLRDLGDDVRRRIVLADGDGRAQALAEACVTHLAPLGRIYGAGVFGVELHVRAEFFEPWLAELASFVERACAHPKVEGEGAVLLTMLFHACLAGHRQPAPDLARLLGTIVGAWFSAAPASTCVSR